MSTYRATRSDLALAAGFEANNLPCRFCGMTTDRETLGRLGARCQACYDAYVGADPNAPAMSTEEKRAALLKLRGAFGTPGNSRRWAERLRYVEEQRDGVLPPAKHAGRPITAARPLTPFQRGAWREARRVSTTTTEDAE